MLCAGAEYRPAGRQQAALHTQLSLRGIWAAWLCVGSCRQQGSVTVGRQGLWLFGLKQHLKSPHALQDDI